MTKAAVASWLTDHSTIPQRILKPVATRLGVPTNYLGAALFAGQLVYENQQTIVTYAGKGGVTVGEFLYTQARQRYGEDHPMTQHLGENVDAITEVFEGTEQEARTFAEFYRRYRALDREYHPTGEFDLGVLESVRNRLPSVRGSTDPNDGEAVEIPVTAVNDSK